MLLELIVRDKPLHKTLEAKKLLLLDGRSYKLLSLGTETLVEDQ